MPPLHGSIAGADVVFHRGPGYMGTINGTPDNRAHDKVKKMSAIDTNRIHTGTASFGFGSKLWAAISAWNDARMTRNALCRLTDRELDDIGLTRGDIEYISRAR